MNEFLTQDEIDQLLAEVEKPKVENKQKEDVDKKRFIRIYDFMRPELLSKTEKDRFETEFGTLKQGKRLFTLKETLTCSFGNIRRFTEAENGSIIEMICSGAFVYAFVSKEHSKKLGNSLINSLVKKILNEAVTFKKRFPAVGVNSLVPDSLNGVVFQYIENDNELEFDLFFPEETLKVFFKNKVDPFKFSRVSVPVSIVLGKGSAKLEDLAKEGAIIELDCLAGEPVSIFSGGEEIGKGEVVVVGPEQRFGIRVL